MSFSRSASDNFTSAISSPTLLPPHGIKLLDYIGRNPGSPASLVLSPSTTLSMPIERVKPKPSAFSTNAVHRNGQTSMNGGRWTEEEHQRFLAGLRLYGREWKKVASKIKTRTSAQIRSHAQKYFAKLSRDDEMRKRYGLSVTIPESLGYFSDGGSSIAQNSSDNESNPSDISRQMVCTRSTGQTKGIDDIFVAPLTAAAGKVYQPKVCTTQKRLRVRQASVENQLGLPSSRFPIKLYIRTHDATQVQRLPSQEELVAKASPNLRHRLSSLIEAELCALQVLSCYAMSQQQDHILASRYTIKQQGKPCTLTTTASSSTTESATSSSHGLSMLSTEQIRSTSSIY